MTIILYVEDNFQNFRLVSRMLRLEKKNYDIHQAEDGETALKLAPELNPELILMDINLPDITGIEVTKRLKAMPEMQGIPIIALTANAMVGDKERFLAAGCDGYLRKPISRDELRGALAEFLEPEATKASDEDASQPEANKPEAAPKKAEAVSEAAKTPVGTGPLKDPKEQNEMRESQIEIKVVKSKKQSEEKSTG